MAIFYKPGQGYWTRTMSVIGFGMLVLAGALWLAGKLSTLDTNRLYWQVGAAAVVIVGFGLLLYRLFGTHKRIVDFCIATETEMKKVNWPDRKSIIGSTAVVIGGVLFIAALLFAIDFGFAGLFRAIGILESGA